MLITSSRDPHTLAPIMCKHLGKDLEFSTFLEPEDSYEPSLRSRIWRRLTRRRRIADINHNLLKTLEAGNYKALWVFKGMNLLPKTLQTIQSLGVALFNYNADHPLDFFSPGSGNQRVRDAYPFYDAHFTYSHEICKTLLDQHPSVPVYVVPFGHDVSEVLYRQLTDVPEIRRACFIGNPDVERATQLSDLVKRGIELDVYGAHWNKYIKSCEGVRIHKQVLGLEYFKTLRRYRVQLNFLRPHNKNSHNMRSFEVPAAGGIMLAPRTDEHVSFFSENQEACYFDSLGEAANRCHEILNWTVEKANTMRTQARHRSVRSAYGYEQRARQVLDGMLQQVSFKNSSTRSS
jgi:spore maturation protein CgeB